MWAALFAGLGMGLNLLAEEEEARAKRVENIENRRLAESAAADAMERGALESGRARLHGGKLLAAQKAAYAASGVVATSGTAAAVQADTAAMTELDARTLENNAMREAWGFRRFGVKYQQQAALDERRSQYRKAGTVLQGASRIYESS